MGYRITIKHCDIDVTLPVKTLCETFKKCDIKIVKDHGKKAIRVYTETEDGWIGVWADFNEEENCHLYAYGSSRSFYSRNGRWFLNTLEQLVVDYGGNLLLITKEPDTGGSKTTIIYEGDILYGCFSQKLGSPFGFRSVWKSQYDPIKDVDTPVNIKIYDIMKNTTETLRIDSA